VGKRLVVVMQRAGGQSQFSPWLDAMADPASPIAEVQRQILAQLRQPWPVAELARLANMSLRSFTRSFGRETGMAPAQFIQRARIEAARKLESGDLPIKGIAYECGFGDAGRMRQAFVRALGVSPQRYREAFRQRDPACRLA
jgi:transcriptional regulator GlxA family with amidase domain